MNSILPDSDLPIKYVAYSHCFRTEAGAAGAATRYISALLSWKTILNFFECLH
jgi:seryl-tRNA synthetase